MNRVKSFIFNRASIVSGDADDIMNSFIKSNNINIDDIKIEPIYDRKTGTACIHYTILYTE